MVIRRSPAAAAYISTRSAKSEKVVSRTGCSDAVTASCRPVETDIGFAAVPRDRSLRCNRHPIPQESFVFLQKAGPMLEILPSIVWVAPFVVGSDQRFEVFALTHIGERDLTDLVVAEGHATLLN